MRNRFVVLHCIYHAITLFWASLIWVRNPSWTISEFSGRFTVDGMLALALALFTCCFKSKLKLYTSWTIVILLAALGYSDYINHVAHGRNVQLQYAGYAFDWVFVKSSIQNYEFILMIFLVCFSCYLLKRWILEYDRSVVFKKLERGLIIVGLFSFGYLLGKENWNSSFYFENISSIFDNNEGGATKYGLIEYREKLPKHIVHNEIYQTKKKNVLLITLEGVSGLHLKSIAKHHNVNTPYEMPYLESFAKKGITFTNFFTEQAQTNRGLYALLSGRKPALRSSTPKMTSIALRDETSEEFLTKIFSESGYNNTFIQGSDLSFMNKGRFMEKIGFDYVYGSETSGSMSEKVGWGVDDSNFFNYLAKYLVDISKNQSPWFVTALNVGTHHPYNLPKSFRSDLNDDFARSLLFLDKSLQSFFNRLNDEGVLEKTMVIITSDESHGVSSFEGYFHRKMSYNHGLLIVYDNERLGKYDHRMFAQSDIAISLTDYLLGEQASNRFMGRSLFRNYETNRKIVLANTYSRSIIEIDEDNGISLFDDNYVLEKQVPVVDDRIYENRSGVWDVNLEWLKGVVEASVGIYENDDTIKYRLAKKQWSSLENGEKENVFGGQYFRIDGKKKIGIDISGKVVFTKDPIRLALSVPGFEDRFEYRTTALLNKGGPFEFSYSSYNSTEVDRVSVELLVEKGIGNDVEIVFDRAFLVVEETVEDGTSYKLSKQDVSPKQENDDCLEDKFKTRLVDACVIQYSKPGFYIFGPWRNYRSGERIKFQTKVRPRESSCVAFVDVVAIGEEGPVYKSEEIRIEKGHTHEFLEIIEPTKEMRGLEYRLYVKGDIENKIDILTHNIEVLDE